MTDRYLFIDGQYLDFIYKKLMNEFVGNDGEIDLDEVRKTYKPAFGRVFYYHALEDDLRENEAEADMNERVAEQRQRFDAIAALPGFHTRLGSVTGKTVKRRRQKMVDVQLAVDALTHGFNKNMTLAVFLAGDLDFRPVVDALVNMGIYTEVIYEPSSASRNLYRAGDGSLAVDLFIAHQWSTAEFKRKHPFPIKGNGRPKSSLNGMIPLKVGNVGNVHAFAAQETHGPFWIWVDSGPHGEQYAVTHARLETLEAVVKYFHFGVPIVWTKTKA